MFTINKYLYVDRHTRNKFEVFARTVDFADKLIERINKIGVFNLRRARIGFAKIYETEKPPFEVEQEQISVVEEWEANNNGKKKEKR